MAHDADAEVRLEPAGVPPRPVLWTAFASIALVLGAIWGLKAVYDWRVADRTLPAPEQFPSPRVQTHQAEQLQDLLAAQRRHLSGYAWADAGKTLVRIPIERAMEIIAQRGADAYAPLVTPSPAPSSPAAGRPPATTGQGAPRGLPAPERRP
ncbi:MAG: hypothetical protein J2P53_06145 [Bradyrhizobiaceae bacterium]|nr:hypothetical protein [Bradyrhizobiaceae bacterium]